MQLIHLKMDDAIAFQFLITLTLTLILLISITKYLSKSAKGERNRPPSPWKLPILGNLHQVGWLPHRSLHSMAKKHGPIMLLHLGRAPLVIASSAAAAAEIMKTHDLDFADRPVFSVSRRLLYDNKDVSFAPYGEYWRQLKSICVVQLLSNRRVQSFRSVRAEEMEIMVRKIGDSSAPVNLSQLFTQLMNDVVGRSAIGRNYGGGDENGERSFPSIIREFMELLGSSSIGDLIPSLWWINRINGFDRRVDRVAKEMDDFLEGMIRDRLDNPPEENAEDNFIDILLEIYRNNSIGVFDRNSIKAIILDAFVAGTDTTSTVLEWTMAELLRNPKIMKKLQNEVRGVVKDKQNISDDDLEKLPYLKAVFKESMRLHTPIPLLVPRVARNDVQVMGYDVSVGDMVMINAWAIGRDPASWDKPEEFRPERFLNSSIDFKGLDFELIPFGSGRRGCPGIAFAMTINEYALASLVRKFDWQLPDGCQEVDMSERPGIATRKLVPLLAVGTYKR